MAEPFLAEIRMFGFNFPPRGYALCDGQILPIDQNQSLFSLLGNTFGGDGRTSFGLPELRGRTPVHVGTGFSWGARDGEEAHQLAIDEMPGHTHEVNASTDTATANSPAGNLPATSTFNVYGSASGLGNANTATVADTGGTPHNNMQPFLVINFCIALSGTFPPRN